MNRSSLSNPLLLGFEHLERVLDASDKADGYPPYNIENAGDGHLKLILAVAGFTPEDLCVTVEENQLVIRGRQIGSETKTYLHRGIASRQFQRCFVLADGIAVKDAELNHGLLTIELERQRHNRAVRTIPIHSPEVQLDGAIDRT